MISTTASSQLRFNYQQFLALGNSDLVAYMEPLVNDPTVGADPADLHRIHQGLVDFDEYHLVYAIEFGMDRMPGLFGASVARCLAHPCQSARLAAHRALSRMPSREITEGLIEACRESIAIAPAAEVGDLPDILASRRPRPE